MSRSLIVWVALGFLVLGAGCRMCAHSLDYCGPLSSGKCGEQCDPSYRAGSILAGTVQPVPDDVTEADVGQQADTDFGVPPEQILSITDRTLEEPPAEASPAADQPTVARRQPAGSQGWTAHKVGVSTVR